MSCSASIRNRLPLLFAPLAAILSLTACVTSAIPLEHRPAASDPLPAADVHGVRFQFVVEDQRELDTDEDLCPNEALFHWGPLRSTRAPATIVKEALQREFESHDLRVVEAGQADLVIHVELLQFTCWLDRDDQGPLGRKQARALIESKISVRDGLTGQEYYWFNPRSEGRYRPLSLIYTNDPYTGAFEAALDRLAGRTVRRPQLLIAAQRVAARVR